MSVSNFKDFLNVYEFTTVLDGSGQEIKFKPLVTKQLKKLLAHDAESNQEANESLLDELISGCVLNEDFKVEELYLLDRVSLLFEIRKKSKGEQISTTKVCSKCGLESIFTIDLNNIERKQYIKNDDGIAVAGGKIKLQLDHLKRKDQKEVYNNVKQQKQQKDGGRIAAFEFNKALIAQSIVSVETAVGKEDSLSFEDKQYIVDNLSTLDLNLLTQWHTDNAFGINFKYIFTCAHCKNTEEADIPLNDFLS